MKSLPRRLRDIADLLAALSVTNADLVAMTVYGNSELNVHVRPATLLRISQTLRVPASRVKIKVDAHQNLHASFTARGACWTCCVLIDSEAGRPWREWLENRTRAALAHQPKALPQSEKSPPFA